MNDRQAARRLLFRHLRMMVEGKRDGRLVAARGRVRAELEEFGERIERRMGASARKRFMALYDEERNTERATFREGELAETACRPETAQVKAAILVLLGWFAFGVAIAAMSLLGRR